MHLQAGIYSLVKKHEQALTAIQCALRMYQNVNTVARDEWHRDMAIMLRDAADIYHELKKFKLARDSMEEASKHIAAIDEQDESDAKLEKICHVRDQMAAECDQLQLKADQHELAMVLVPEDGDCFYTAVALQLAQSDDEDLKGLSAHDLRMLAVEYICTRRDEYAGFMEGDFDEYLARHSKARTWADNVMITALANALSLNIVIIAGRYDEWTVFKRSGNKTVCLGFIPEFHYVAMPSKAAPLSASPSVLRVLAAQQEDGVTPPQPCVQPVEVHVGEKNESTNEEQPGPAKRPRIHSPAESFAVEAMVGLSSAGAVPTKSVSPVQTTAMLMERFGVGSTAAYVSADQVNAKEAMAHSGHDDNFPMVTDAHGLADKSNPTTTLRPS